jgi:hypothetical protein
VAVAVAMAMAAAAALTRRRRRGAAALGGAPTDDAKPPAVASAGPSAPKRSRSSRRPGAVSNRRADGRSSGSDCSIIAMSSRSAAEYCASMGGYVPRRIFRISPCTDWASKACERVASSYSTQPSAQMSDLKLYASLRHISGDM